MKSEFNKFECTRVPKRNDYQQTYFFVTPSIQVWLDGKKYNQWAFSISWFLWTLQWWFVLDNDTQ